MFLLSISITLPFVRLLLSLIRTLSKFQFNFCSELYHLIRLRLSLWLKVGYSASTLQSQKVGLPFCSNNKTSLGFQSTNPINNDLLLHRFGTFFSFLIVNCTDVGLKLFTFPGLLMSFIHEGLLVYHHLVQEAILRLSFTSTYLLKNLITLGPRSEL